MFFAGDANTLTEIAKEDTVIKKQIKLQNSS
jgi:hypothetical protein